MNKDTELHVFRFSAKELKICTICFLVLGLVVVIGAYITAVREVPRQKAQIEGLAEHTFTPAERFFKDVDRWAFIGLQQLRDGLILFLDNGEHPLNVLNKNLKGQYVIVQMPTGDIVDAATMVKIDRVQQRIRAEVATLSQQIDTAGWADRYELDRKLNEKQRLLEKINGIVESFKRIRFRPVTELPYAADLSRCHFLAGVFERFESGEDDQINVRFANVRVVLDDDFLIDHGVPVESVSKQDISADRKLMDETEARLTKQLRVKLLEMQERIDAMVEPGREHVRERFYRRWLPVLFFWLGIYFSVRILVRFFVILRRKGVSGKSTESIYYATNKTSKILRYIALLVVGLGIASLGIQGLLSALSGFGSPGLSLNVKILALLFNVLSLSDLLLKDRLFVLLILAVLTPFVHTLLTMVASWLWVLWSEFICFISNVYHVMFLMVYGERVKEGDRKGM